MTGIDVIGADRGAIAGIVATTSRPWWKTALLYSGSVAAIVLGWSTVHELIIRRQHIKRYGNPPVDGRHWDRTLMTGVFDRLGLNR